MGTRADFYAGRGAGARWLGSVAWSGTVEGLAGKPGGQAILDATTEAEFCAAVEQHIRSRADGTLPEQSWPWPWDDSGSTESVFAFDAGAVFFIAPMPCREAGVGRWVDVRSPHAPRDLEPLAFPDMSALTNFATDERSGLGLAIGVPLKTAVKMALRD